MNDVDLALALMQMFAVGFIGLIVIGVLAVIGIVIYDIRDDRKRGVK